MKYFSTRNSNEKVSASWAISHGLAPDGGLYVPESLPMLSLDDIKTLGKKDYRGRALSIMKPFLDEFTEDELKAMILRAYGDNFDSADTAPVHFLDEKQPFSSCGTVPPAHLRIWLFRCFRIC